MAKPATEYAEFSMVFLDGPSHASLGAISRWVDSIPTQTALFSSLCHSQALEDLLYLFSKNAVNRKNVVEILISGEDWEKVVGRSRVRVFPYIMRVGRTSWSSHYDIFTSLGVPLGRVQTVMVAVDAATLTKPVPVPHAELLRSMVQDVPSLDAPAVKPRGEAPSITWRVEVRKTDCDSLGHLNNTVYASLMEDARHVAVRSKKFPKLAEIGTCMASIDYLSQPHAGDMLDIIVWWDDDVSALGLEFAIKEEVVAKCVLAPWAKPVRAAL